MESLRTRRPSAKPAPAGKPQQRQRKIVKDARKSRVDDKIKKRMSMRYADISGPVLGLPDVPNLPNSTSVRPGRDQDESVRDRSSVKEDPWAANKKLLEAEDFDPDACEWLIWILLRRNLTQVVVLRTKLANSTESEIRSLQSALRGSQDETASDLRRNVFKKSVLVWSRTLQTVQTNLIPCQLCRICSYIKGN
jgi:exocyst complex component 8